MVRILVDGNGLMQAQHGQPQPGVAWIEPRITPLASALRAIRNSQVEPLDAPWHAATRPLLSRLWTGPAQVSPFGARMVTVAPSTSNWPPWDAGKLSVSWSRLDWSVALSTTEPSAA